MRRTRQPARLTWLALVLVSAVRAQFSPEPPLADTPILPGRPPVPTMPGIPGDLGDPPTPAVAIRVRVPASVNSGADITYRITVENLSRAAAHHVVVRNPLPANAQFVSAVPEPTEKEPQLRWQIGTLQALERKEITLVLKPTGRGEVMNIARVVFEHGESVRTMVGNVPAAPVETTPMPRADDLGRPALRIRTRTPPQTMVEQGTVLTYTVDVANTGTGTARNVVLESNFSDGLKYSTSRPAIPGEKPFQWRLGDIPAGQTRTVELTLLSPGLGSQAVKFEARDASGLKQEDLKTIIVGESKLDIVITGPATRLVNRPAEYLITVRNTGNVPATNVIVKSAVPEDAEFVDASRGGRLGEMQKRFNTQAQREIASRDCIWLLGTLMAQEKQTLRLVLRTPHVGGLHQWARVDADRGVTARGECYTTFTAGGSGVHVEIDESMDPVEVGGTCIYTVRVLNQGGDPANKIALTIEVPEQMKFVTVQKKPTDFTVNERGMIIFQPLVSLAARAMQEYVIELQAVKPGDARFRVLLTTETVTKPLVAEESTRIYMDKQQ
jgi:uncharacterized repeat protein (TIGR01451 family)